MAGPKIHHVVLMQFPEGLSDEDERSLFQQIHTWPETIGLFDRLRIGKNTSELHRGYGYSLFIEFADQEAYDRYRPHPAHRTFADWCYERDCQFLVVDFPMDGGSVLVGD
jgi:hypothetical protein